MVPFPFSAMVGQENLRLALILNAISPSIGGVLIYGRRGTGKSTAVRACIPLFPAITGIADCPYFCDPTAPHEMCSRCQQRNKEGEILPAAQSPVRLTTLPLNVSEDRVAGSFDLAAALEGGAHLFAPGLLATANRGILYVDEINLLNDHIVDLLLDVTGSGVNHVEREGISIIHPAHFVLIGTMNPEEGLLRPQLLDRIGLCVEAEDLRDPVARATVVERRLAYDVAPADFAAQWAGDEQTLQKRILQARQVLPTVRISPYFRQVVSYLVDRQSRAKGHRGDIAVIRTARALAAWDNRQEVERTDIEKAVALALPHRTDSGKAIVQQLIRTLDQLPGGTFDTEQPEELGVIDTDIDERTDEREGAAGITRYLRGEQDARQLQDLISISRDRLTRVESGRRFISLTSRRSGRSPRARQIHPVTDMAFAATIRAAAPYQQIRGRTDNGRLKLQVDDLRQKVRERKTRSLLIFVIDGSDSVMARQLMDRMKRVLLALLQNAYEKRDRIAMLVFRFAQGRIVLPPTRNFTSARRCVEELYVGGCTPLATGLLEGLRLAETERLRDPTVKPLLIVLTDGLANIDLSGNMRSSTPWRDALSIAQEIAARQIPSVMIDTNPFATSSSSYPVGGKEEGMVANPGRQLALTLAADYYQLCPPNASTLIKRG